MDYKDHFLILKNKTETLELMVRWKIISNKILNWVSLILGLMSRQLWAKRKEGVYRIYVK